MEFPRQERKNRLMKFFGDILKNPKTKRKSKSYLLERFDKSDVGLDITIEEQIITDIECGMIALGEADKYVITKALC